MKPFIIAFGALLIATASAAGEPRIPLVHPKPSPLKVTALTRTNNHQADFSGSIWVTGTLYVDVPEGSTPAGAYRVVPDAGSRKKLPHFTRYGVTWIEINNGPEALRMAAGQALSQRVSDGSVKSFAVTGAWKLMDYSVGIECNAPYAYATVVDVNIPSRRLAAVSRPERC